jgi:prepilin-type N-terminal cleavage/methylation domain-containing protein
MPRLTRSSLRARRGFTLTELMITVVLFALVMAALMNVIVRQQKFYRGANEVIDTRTQIRQAMSVLPLDLRAVSSIGADIKSISDTAVTVLATFGTGVTCSVGVTDFQLPPLALTQHTLTSWSSTPQAGDSVFIYDEGGLRGSEDDTWQRAQVASVDSTTAGCAPFLLADGSQNGLYRYTVHLRSSLNPSVIPGAVVRFARPVRYHFYQASDAKWYLGYSSFTEAAGGWVGPQPLAGPYRPFDATGATTGLHFRFYAANGTTQITTNDSISRAAIARVDLQLQGIGSATNSAVMLAANASFRDSLLVRVAIRNRD